MEIIGLSMRVTLTAVVLACVIGLPLGAAVGTFNFPGRTLVAVILNALMGLPLSWSACLSISSCRHPDRSGRCACYTRRLP